MVERTFMDTEWILNRMYSTRLSLTVINQSLQWQLSSEVLSLRKLLSILESIPLLSNGFILTSMRLFQEKKISTESQLIADTMTKSQFTVKHSKTNSPRSISFWLELVLLVASSLKLLPSWVSDAPLMAKSIAQITIISKSQTLIGSSSSENIM